MLSFVRLDLHGRAGFSVDVHESGRSVFLHYRLSDVLHVDPAVEQTRRELVPDTDDNRVQIPKVRLLYVKYVYREMGR